MKIGIGVMSHPTRTGQMLRLIEGLGDVHAIAIDHLDRGENATGDECWGQLAAGDADWSIVLQDDALPVADFRRHAELALGMAPLGLVSFYVGTGRPRADTVHRVVQYAEVTDSSWLEADTLLWGVGVAMPTVLIDGFLAWTKTGAWGTDFPYDARLGAYFKRLDFPVRYTWPSLVDHSDGPSLVHAPRPDRIPHLVRVAHRVGTRESYDGPVVKIPGRGEVVRGFPLSQ